MATFLAKIKVFEGKEAEFEETARMMYTNTQKEDGLMRYEYWRGTEPRTYYCFESWENYHAFLGHQTSDHHEGPDWPSLLENLEIEWLDPMKDASPLPPTEHQDLPEDASDLVRQHAENIPLGVQSWWAALR